MTDKDRLNLPEDLVQSITREVEAAAEQTISFLKDMIGFKTENPLLCDVEPGAEAELQEFIGKRLRDDGLTTDIWEVQPKRTNLVGTLKGTGGGKSLILNGHVDVVPVGDLSLWEHDPWAAEEIDGNIHGRGTVDMKGGIASMIAAMEAVQRAGVKLKGDLLVNTVIDEETGGAGTRAALERGYRSDAVIVCEPTNMFIQSVEGGLEWLRLVVRGVSGHTAMRYQSVHAGGQGDKINAIEKMMKILQAVMELERHWAVHKVHPLMPKGITTINIGVILGGTGGGKDGTPNAINSPSTFPDYCSTMLSLKFLPSEKTEDVKAEFEDYIHRVAQADPWLRDQPARNRMGSRRRVVSSRRDTPGSPVHQDAVRGAPAVDRRARVSRFRRRDRSCLVRRKGHPGLPVRSGPRAHRAYDRGIRFRKGTDRVRQGPGVDDRRLVRV